MHEVEPNEPDSGLGQEESRVVQDSCLLHAWRWKLLAIRGSYMTQMLSELAVVLAFGFIIAMILLA